MRYTDIHPHLHRRPTPAEAVGPASAPPSGTPPWREPIRTREVGWPTLVLTLAAATALLLLLLGVPRVAVILSLMRGPDWRQNLVVSGTILAVAVGLVAFGLGRLRPADVGAGRRKFGEGVAVLVGVWSLPQVLTAGFFLVTARAVPPHPAWAAPGARQILMWFAVMFGATALYEEVVFRGVLFPQLYLKTAGSARRRFWVAAVASQLVFGAGHIPGHVLLRGLGGAALWRIVLAQAFVGLLLLLVYLRTRNLWVAVGVHAFINAPVPLVDNALPWEPFFVVLMLAWPRVTRRPAQRGLAGVERLGGPPDSATGASGRHGSGLDALAGRARTPAQPPNGALKLSGPPGHS